MSKLSFAFAKSKKNSKLASACTKSTFSNVKHDDKPNEKEFITSIEDNILNSYIERKEEALVIPMKENRNSIINRIRTKRMAVDPNDSLTLQALQELKEELMMNKKSKIEPFENMKIPLGSHETETDDAIDADYDAVPIEKFGVALLTGMGFDPKQLKDAKPESVLSQRPRGLGLGADPHAIEKAKAKFKEPQENLSWKVGSKCQAILGKQKGLYGTIEGMDGDTGRVIVRLTLSKEVIALLQHNLRLVGEKEYGTYANCLNQNEVDAYKAEQAKQAQINSIPADQFNGSTDTDVSKPERSSSHRSFKPIIEPPEVKTLIRRQKNDSSWVRPNLIVECLDKRFRDGRYYRNKMTVVSVSGARCCCKTESDQIVEGILTDYLRTVVPREANTVLMILEGERAGQLARLIKRDTSKDQVDVKTRSGVLMHFTLDCVCAVANPF